MEKRTPTDIAKL